MIKIIITSFFLILFNVCYFLLIRESKYLRQHVYFQYKNIHFLFCCPVIDTKQKALKSAEISPLWKDFDKKCFPAFQCNLENCLYNSAGLLPFHFRKTFWWKPSKIMVPTWTHRERKARFIFLLHKSDPIFIPGVHQYNSNLLFKQLTAAYLLNGNL